eukprot:CAMPEP_0185572424 /NCGR_PEP_ID=MMETSP0434-20130131/4355_1 /TAXON_ID=626734 ORGANISM="Favella taraikaensis, Strain Fe Narragansett Bay" /NCGR_SAMPLE_ID=MMETSP0434 /ASSEMBLY_ACC=CAM_ASM_000379 /LENGTH=36 /DNA_ID= /DNA_START= /DNA_END= /DNA_ORIENTATION=
MENLLAKLDGEESCNVTHLGGLGPIAENESVVLGAD